MTFSGNRVGSMKYLTCVLCFLFIFVYNRCILFILMTVNVARIFEKSVTDASCESSEFRNVCITVLHLLTCLSPLSSSPKTPAANVKI